MNSKIKEVDGAIGVTENKANSELVSGTEIATLVKKFEPVFRSEVVQVVEHHDSSTFTQTHFLRDVKLMLRQSMSWEIHSLMIAVICMF